MDDDIFDEDGIEMSIIRQEWNKVHDAREKDGYVTGATAGQNATIQQGFNNGFKQGMMSSFLIAQIKGILKGILAYSASYEGHPITDDVLLDAERILQEISKIETDKIAEDFLEMHIKPDTAHLCNHSTTDLQCGRFNDISIEANQEEHAMETACEFNENVLGETLSHCESGTSSAVSSEITLSEAKKLLLRCPEIHQVVQHCKDVLGRLRWSDSVLDFLI